MRGGESFVSYVRNPVTKLIVARHDKAAPLTMEGVANRKIGVATVIVMGEV